MTKSELIQRLAETEGITLKAAEVAVSTVFDSMIDTLVKNGRVEIRGIGSFRVKDYDGYAGRNPRTGELTNVRAKKLPFFKLGLELKQRLNRGREE